MVLAAGLGTRLRPLTTDRPKPALPFWDRPIMAFSLDCLYAAGIRHIGVNGYYLADAVVPVVEAWQRAHADVQLTWVVEDVLMGTGGGAKGVWNAMGGPDAPVLVLNGDIVIEAGLGPILASHEAAQPAATLVVSRSGEGRIRVDSRSERVLAMPSPDGPPGPGPGEEVSFCGASVIAPATLDAFPDGPGCLIRQGLYPQLRQGAFIHSALTTGLHRDVGTPERYWSACLERLNRARRSRWSAWPPGVEVTEPVHVGDSVVFEGSAALGPNVVLGGTTRVRSGANLRDCAVFDGVVSQSCMGAIQVGQRVLGLE